MYIHTLAMDIRHTVHIHVYIHTNHTYMYTYICTYVQSYIHTVQYMTCGGCISDSKK